MNAKESCCVSDVYYLTSECDILLDMIPYFISLSFPGVLKSITLFCFLALYIRHPLSCSVDRKRCSCILKKKKKAVRVQKELSDCHTFTSPGSSSSIETWLSSSGLCTYPWLALPLCSNLRVFNLFCSLCF
jgi:hypothetical protein